jgi:uncharacterized membrane protein
MSMDDVQVALARMDDGLLLAFVIEQHKSGLLTVFIPSAPTPAAGTVYYMTEDRIQRLDVSVAAAVGCIMRLGVGSGELLDKVLPAASAASKSLPPTAETA